MPPRHLFVAANSIDPPPPKKNINTTNPPPTTPTHTTNTGNDRLFKQDLSAFGDKDGYARTAKLQCPTALTTLSGAFLGLTLRVLRGWLVFVVFCLLLTCVCACAARSIPFSTTNHHRQPPLPKKQTQTDSSMLLADTYNHKVKLLNLPQEGTYTYTYTSRTKLHQSTPHTPTLPRHHILIPYLIETTPPHRPKPPTKTKPTPTTPPYHPTPPTQTKTNTTTGEASSSRLAGSGQRGLKDGPGAMAQFSEPRGLAADSRRNVAYVCDSGNHAIRTVDLRTGQVGTVRVVGE